MSSRFAADSIPRRVQIAAVIVGAVAVLGMSVAAVAKTSNPPEVERPTSQPVSDLDKPAEPLNRNQLADVLPRLSDRSRPFNVAVLSDSTGAAAEGWTQLTASWLATKANRDLHYLQWVTPKDKNDQSGAYEANEYNLPEGRRGELNWWNASAPGRNVDYSILNLRTEIPAPAKDVDLVIVNHGHNQTVRLLDKEVGGAMRELAMRYPNAAIVGILQNPESKKSPDYEVHEKNVEALASWCRAETFQCIDVHQAFASQPNYEPLIDDTFVHPTAAGYKLWAGVMTAAFAPEMPKP